MSNDNRPHYGQAAFIDPAPFGYLYLGMRIAPPSRAPVVRKHPERSQKLEQCRDLAREVEAHADVLAASVYEADLIPPIEDSPRFDVLVLIETTTPEAIPAVEATPAIRQLEADFVMRARNIRRIGDVDAPRTGAFLFNHFTGPDFDQALETFDGISGWFTDKAGVRDSALLQPIEESAYVFVNHVRLPTSPKRFMLNFAKPSFRKCVAANLKAHGIRNAPVICRSV